MLQKLAAYPEATVLERADLRTMIWRTKPMIVKPEVAH